MKENRFENYLLCSMLVLTTIMFSWTFLYINQIAINTTNTPIVSAFDA